MATILVIDDDPDIGNLLEEALTRNAYRVMRADSGTAALSLLKSRTPDLILLDLMLPGLSGEQLLPQIKEIPVIVVSAKIDLDNKVSLLLGGALTAWFILHPIQLPALFWDPKLPEGASTVKASLISWGVACLVVGLAIFFPLRSLRRQKKILF